jgi:hypothetical protein
MSPPTTVHYHHLLHVPQYLRDTISRRLFFPRSSSFSPRPTSCLEDEESDHSLPFECRG